MFFNKPITSDQIIALAGMFHACQLVDQLARQGTIDEQQLEVQMRALFEQNPGATYSVYGSNRVIALQNLESGFTIMHEMLDKNGRTTQTHVLPYLISVAFLARKLSRDSAMLDHVGESIHLISAQAEITSVTDDDIISKVAQLYRDTIGTYRQRVQVKGFATHLQQPIIADRIRSLLFAAIRSAILWNQVGGNRVQLLFQRQKVLEQLRQLQQQL